MGVCVHRGGGGKGVDGCKMMMMMVVSAVIVHDSIDLNAQCGEGWGWEGWGGGGS